MIKNKNKGDLLITCIVFVCVLVFCFDFLKLQKSMTSYELSIEDIKRLGGLYKGHFFPNIVISTFSHVSLNHLISNMIGVILYGKVIEKKYSWKEMLTIFLLGSLIGSVASYFLEPKVVSMGASGGLLAWVGMVVGVIDIKDVLKWRNLFLLFLFTAPILSTFVSERINQVAHLGGFLVGFLSVLVIGFLHSAKEK